MSYLRPLSPYPGWKFSLGFDAPENAERRKFWESQTPGSLYYDGPFHHGLNFPLRIGDDLSACLYVNGCYEPNEFLFLEQFLKPGMVVIDCGAHEGIYSLFMAKKVGPIGVVWSFEPSSREFQRLNCNIEGNQLGRVIRPLRCAVGGLTTSILPLTIAEALHSGQNTLGRLTYPGVASKGKEWVPVIPLNSLGVGCLDLIKLDIEGSEAHALAGAGHLLRNFQPAILFEAHESVLNEQGSSISYLLGALRFWGYTIFSFSGETGLLVQDHRVPILLDGENLVALHSQMHPEYF